MRFLSHLADFHISLMPPPERLVHPIYDALLRAMRAQVIFPGIGDADLMRKSPADLQFALVAWTQKLGGVQADLYKHATYGVYYRRYQIDKAFAESTLNAPLFLTPGHWALNVIQASRRSGAVVAGAS